MEPDAPVLSLQRTLALVALLAAAVAWFEIALHLPYAGDWPSVAIVAAAVLPGTLALVFLALPLWPRWRWLLPVGVALVVVAIGCWEEGWYLAANFAKLGAAVCAGWLFLAAFAELSWVVLVALLVPVFDAVSVFAPQGPTHEITQHHIAVYNDIAVAFPVPGGRAAQLGPPDILFYALFLAAAARWRLRPGWTWIGTTGMYSLTIVVANAAAVNGLPALPFLSCGFLAANADLLWRRLRPARS